MSATTYGRPGTDDEWGVQQLDLHAYLARIGHEGPLAPDLATLTALHRAHTATIPFENLDIVLGRGVSVDLGTVQDRVVTQRRGGYCYAHAGLFAAALEQLGFDVHRVLSRVGPEGYAPRARSHLTLIVTLDGMRWLADVGMGFGLMEPLPFDGAEHRQDGWTYRLLPVDGGWRLQELRAGDWSTLHSFSSEERIHASDVVAANHYMSTFPRSPFASRLFVSRKDPDALHLLSGRELTVTRAGGTADSRVLSDTEVVEALEEVFGLPLTTEEVTRVTAALAAPGGGGPGAGRPPGVGGPPRGGRSPGAAGGPPPGVGGGPSGGRPPGAGGRPA